jgi:hypothetical protein
MLLLLVAAAAPAADATRGQPPQYAANPPRVQTLLALLERLATTYGQPLLEVRTVVQLDDALRRIAVDDRFLADYLALAREFTDIRGLPLSDEVPPGVIARVISGLVPEQRGPFVQGLQVCVEIWQRLPSPVVLEMPLTDDAALHDLREHRSDPMFQLVMEGALSGLAVSLLVAGRVRTTRLIGSEIVRKWFDANRRLLAAMDPLQAALDRALLTLPEPTRSRVLRIAYAWASDDEPALVIWFVMRDDAEREEHSISGNIVLLRHMGQALAAAERPDVPFFLRLRRASEVS